MASHHHHHQINPLPTTTCCCSHCCTPPPPPPQTDPLVLQALASHLLILQQQQQQPNLYSHYPNKPHNLHHQKQKHFHHKQQQQDQLIVPSLVHRIDALESSFQHLFSSSSSKYNHHYPFPYASLRDSAARVIQTHFRAFLVHRSRTLSQLKHLAFIKSSFNSLKSSISNKTHFDFQAVSHKAMDLLIKLDSIQGGDPMIRDGKRSISRDLVRFLEFIDALRHQVSYKAAKNVRFSNKSRVLRSNCRNLGGDQREIIEKLRDRVEKISGFSRVFENDEESFDLEGFHQVIDDGDEQQNPIVSINRNGGVLVKRHGGQARVKKNVSFAENENVYRPVSSGDDGILIDGSDSSEDQGEVENLCNEVEGLEGGSKGSEDDEEAHFEHGGRARIEVGGDYQGQNKNFVFSAPMPVKMESRANLMKKNRVLKIVT